MKKKIFKQHYSGLWVAEDGEVLVPKSGNCPEHYTYGTYDKKGYRVVTYQGKKYKVHRLVAEVYLPNPDGKSCIDHINTNRSDNRVENLRWVTQKENNNNPMSRKNLSESLKGENNPMYGKHHREETLQKMSEVKKGKHHTEEARKKMSESQKIPVVGTHMETGYTVEFESAKDAWLTLNIDRSHITKCCKGKLKSAGGYYWSYLT